MWFKAGDVAHLKSNQIIFGKCFKYNDGLKILKVDSKRESYVCEVIINGKVREVELSEKDFVSPAAWARTKELEQKLREIGLSMTPNRYHRTGGTSRIRCATGERGIRMPKNNLPPMQLLKSLQKAAPNVWAASE
jgi:hypothetical protein